MLNITTFKKQLIQSKQKGLALDIDETLAWTIGYWVQEMQIRFGNPENLSIKELITKYRYTNHVPYWQTAEATAWMHEHRNSNEIQEVLPLIENANKIVQKINTIIPIVAYITTRPDTVVEGTKKWLKKHNFPDVEIIANTPKSMNDHLLTANKWKAQVLEELYPYVTGIIDDNPGVVENLSPHYKGTVFLYDNIDHPRKDIHVISCKTWTDVLNQVSKLY